MHSRSFHELTSGTDFVWSVRVIPDPAGQAIASAGRNLFTVCGQASFKDTVPYPSAVEYLLGILGGDLLCGFAANARRFGVALYGLEVAISGRLNNPLVHLGVIGEQGHPGFETISGTLYVSADAEEALPDVWEETLRRSPLFNTLNRAVELSFKLEILP